MIDELWPHWRSEWVVHHDDHLLVVDKPAGVAAHPSDAVEVSDVGARLRAWLGKKPAILHGLDREASGIMLLALDKNGARSLAEQLERGVRWRHVVGIGEPAWPGLSRRGDLAAEIVEQRGGRMLIAVDEPSGGVRRALADAGAPIAGDRDHRGPPAARLMWHVAEVRIAHPKRRSPVAVRAPLPPAMTRWLELGQPVRDVDARLREAAERRYALARRDDTNAYRLVHGAGDELAGVEVDSYDEWAVVSLAADQAIAAREAILDSVSALGFRGVYLKLRGRQPHKLVDTRRLEVAPPLPVRGEGAPDRLWARELGVEYAARLGDGLSTGIFLDQRNGRRWLREAARDKSVLNLFAYHAGFTVAAIAGGARRTVSVDASGAALDGARINLRHALGSAELGDRHQLVKADAIAWLAAGGERFDVVVLDPPSFATTHRSTLHVERDYRRLAASAMRRVAPGGTLLACTNLRRMSAELFRRELAAAAREVGREIARMKTMPPPLDFPPPPGEPWHLKSERIELS